jgi:hypothetical protein
LPSQQELNRSLHNEGRIPSQRDVEAVLREVRGGSTSNPDVLAIEQHEIQTAVKKGFPRHMYHATLEPVVAKDTQDVKGLQALGYKPYYIPREYPMYIHRRNFSPRYRLSDDSTTRLPSHSELEFVESRIVRDAAHFEQIMREPIPVMPDGVDPPSDWVKDVNEIPPIERGSRAEDQLMLARTQGQLEEAQRMLNLHSKDKDKK